MPGSVSCCNSYLTVCIDFPGESGIVSCWGMEDLFGLKFKIGCQASFQDGAWNLCFLYKCNKEVRVALVFQQETRISIQVIAMELVLISSCGGTLCPFD